MTRFNRKTPIEFFQSLSQTLPYMNKFVNMVFASIGSAREWVVHSLMAMAAVALRKSVVKTNLVGDYHCKVKFAAIIGAELVS